MYVFVKDEGKVRNEDFCKLLSKGICIQLETTKIIHTKELDAFSNLALNAKPDIILMNHQTDVSKAVKADSYIFCYTKKG